MDPVKDQLKDSRVRASRDREPRDQGRIRGVEHEVEVVLSEGVVEGDEEDLVDREVIGQLLLKRHRMVCGIMGDVTKHGEKVMSCDE